VLEPGRPLLGEGRHALVWSSVAKAAGDAALLAGEISIAITARSRIYDERFRRMWEFYLIGSEFSFHPSFNTVLARDIDSAVRLGAIGRSPCIRPLRERAAE
jgi:hypothetical protein